MEVLDRSRIGLDFPLQIFAEIIFCLMLLEGGVD
jgi:hypothetical protein